MRAAAIFAALFVIGGFCATSQVVGSSEDFKHNSNFTCLNDLQPGPGKPAKEGSATKCVATPPPPRACPLDMHVRQRAGGDLVQTDAQGRRVTKFVPRLTMELHDPRPDRGSQRMISAMVTVTGLVPRARAVPLDPDEAGNGKFVRHIFVALAGGNSADASAELRLPGFAVAQTVQLESITFDDGQVWTLKSCRAAPDLFMPVEGSM